MVNPADHAVAAFTDPLREQEIADTATGRGRVRPSAPSAAEASLDEQRLVS
jgi:hypothetical protein